MTNPTAPPAPSTHLAGLLSHLASLPAMDLSGWRVEGSLGQDDTTVTPADPTALAAAFRLALERDPGKRETLSSKTGEAERAIFAGSPMEAFSEAAYPEGLRLDRRRRGGPLRSEAGRR